MDDATLRSTILATMADLVPALLNDDRKDDEDLPRHAIDDALEAGKVDLGEMLEAFVRELGEWLEVDIKLDVVYGDRHRYWSTHCRHDPGDGSGHRACASTEIRRGGGVVPKTPARCKSDECAAPCVCPCHVKGSTDAADL